MGNVTLPTPVFLAGGAFCLLAGYLVGTVAGPDAPDGARATVVSFDRGASELCLTGDAVEDEKGVDDDGNLCGTWNRPAGATLPAEGDTFRFVTMNAADLKGSEPRTAVVIYGAVVPD